jgi:phosphate transport system permease protein
MDLNPLTGARLDSINSQQYQRRRLLKDRLARLLVRMGGLAVLGMMLMMLFYLAWVVLPLFTGAELSQRSLQADSRWRAGETAWLSLEEQSELGLHIGHDGRYEFFSLDGLGSIEQASLLPEGATAVNAVSASLEQPDTLAIALDDGRALLRRHRYTTQFSGDVSTRSIVAAIEPLWADEAYVLAPGGGISALAMAVPGGTPLLAALAGGQLFTLGFDVQPDLFGGLPQISQQREAAGLGYQATAVALDGRGRWVYVGGHDGALRVYALPGLELLQTLALSERPLTAMSMLLGGTSLLTGDAGGAITQLFPVRDEDDQWSLASVRSIGSHRAAITQLLPEQRRRGFLALDASGMLGIHHSTAGRSLLMREHGLGSPVQLALAPRADAALLVGEDGAVDWLDIHNPHPEVSFATLWNKVWYENYAEPERLWQSTAATNDFEPKFSLTPLAFGTLKAALYAMLFAVPLALMGATYTAMFMAPALRRKVKPTIETMAALPTVILGFLAGLWLAPFIEQHLAALLTMILVLPVGLFVFAYAWNRAPASLTATVADGWEPVLLMPVLVALVSLSMVLAGPVQNLFFAGDLGVWLSQEAGIAYDQRNALIVGAAMGFSVIPTIYSIAEDALFAVPRSLSEGSLALGATRWQTLVKVVLPTASPGIFSGLMIGMGRAVGETMIVLMATGNTAIMDWSLFEGMRTLAANIAIEMPESEVASTHFRILFLSALVLFVFTFAVNTIAEVVRQRLRSRYSEL